MTGFLKAALRCTALGAGGFLFAAATASADQVFNDDVIVIGSLCVGVDCVNGESFGFDTIRLKENNLRIRAQDTSSSAGFPTVDWQLTFNESDNGGLNKFSIDDLDNSLTPFTIEAGTRSNQLYLDSANRVGFGTATPVTDLHVRQGNTPTVRLEQDGSSGFVAQTWDLAGNETNFFVRDVTNGSDLPFRIFPNAGTSALVIEGTTGDIGVGIQNPTAPLHVRRTDGTAAVLIEEAGGTTAPRGLLTMRNNGIVFFSLEDTSIAAGPNTGREWNFQNQSGTFRVTTAPGGAGDIEMQLDVGGNLTIEGEITTAGSCSAGCDRVFDPDYALPTISEQVAAMYANRHLPNVGPTPEEGPMNLSQKVGGMLNELEKAHIYIGQLHERDVAAQQRIAELTARLTELETRLAE